MGDERTTILWVLKVLKEHSDENHILQMSEIISIIEDEGGTVLDRRTITAAVKALIDFGYDISVYSENKKGYYLRDRDFEISEIILMMDAIYSYRGIPANQTTDIIEKLQKGLSKYQRKNYRNLISVKPSFKTQTNKFFTILNNLTKQLIHKSK